MYKFIKLKKHGTNVRTEIVAGLPTFITMPYFIVTALKFQNKKC